MMQQNDDKEQIKSVKLDQKKSRFAKKTEIKHQFETEFEEALEKNNNYNEAARVLGQHFLDIMIDKTLSSEKGEPAKQREDALIRQLLEIGMKFNNDPVLLEQEQESMGSMVLLTLVFKTLKMFRDRIVQLEYENFQLKKA